MLTAQQKLTFALIDKKIKSGETTMRNQSSNPPNGAAERLEVLYGMRARYVQDCGGREPCEHCNGKGWKLAGADLMAECPYCGGEGDVSINA